MIRKSHEGADVGVWKKASPWPWAVLMLGVFSLLIFASSCGSSCLEESTLVKTSDGLQPIGTLGVGDVVISVDPFTGVEVANRVAQTTTTWAWCEKLVIGGKALWLTAEHPLYSPEARGFRPAQEWLSGELDRTLSENGAERATRPSGWLDQRPCRVVDLSVADAPHTFVAEGVVVHNKEVADCQIDEDCIEGLVCVTGNCRPDDGTGGAGGDGGAGGEGAASGTGGGGGA